MNALQQVKESPPLSLMVFLGMMSTSRHDMTSRAKSKSQGRLRSMSSSHRERKTTFGENYKGSRQVIHVSKLTDYVQFGDIVVFKSNNFLATMQRKVCSSEWDHVGIIVRRRNNRYLELLESTGDGVSCYPLKNRLRAYMEGYAHQIGVRRLKLSRTPEMQKALSDFAMQVNGKPYALTLSKLISTKRKQSQEKLMRQMIV